MFDRKKLQRDLEESKKFKGPGFGGAFTFTFARAAQFNPGDYLFRLIPEDKDKNPDGYVVITKVGIERDSTSPAESTRFVSIDSSESTYIQGILQQIQQRGLLDKVSKGLQDSLKKLYPQVRYLFPALFKAEATVTKGTNGKDVTKYSESRAGTIQPVIFEVYGDSSIIPQLFDIAETHREFNTAKYGQWLKLNKAPTKYTLSAPGVETALTDEERELYANEKYPNLVKIAQKDKCSHSELVDLVETAYWKRILVAEGIDFTDYKTLGKPNPWLANQEDAEADFDPDLSSTKVQATEVPFGDGMPNLDDLDNFDPLK